MRYTIPDSLPILMAFELTSVIEEIAWIIMSIRKKPGENVEILTILGENRQKLQDELLPHLEIELRF